MGEPLIKESYPGSGVTKDGTRINPNMKDHSNDPFIIKKVARARATLDKYGIEFFQKMFNKK